MSVCLPVYVYVGVSFSRFPHVYFSVRLSGFLWVCLSVCLSLCLSVTLSVFMLVCLSVCHCLLEGGGVQVNNASGHCGKRKRQTRISRTSCLCRKLRQCFNCNNPTTVAFQCQYIRVCSETSGYVMKTLNPGVLRGGVSPCLC